MGFKWNWLCKPHHPLKPQKLSCSLKESQINIHQPQLNTRFGFKLHWFAISLKAKLFFHSQHRDFLLFFIIKKFHNHLVIIHLGRLLRSINVKVWKMPWKLRFSESQYCFANISATEAQIFMKFYVVLNFYLVSFKYYQDPCISARAQVVNARINNITCACTFTTRARAFMHGAW